MYLSSADIIGEIQEVEVIAAGRKIRLVRQLIRKFGRGRWRKMKGIARIRLRNGSIRRAEIHWYEAHGVGKKSIKVKRFVS